MYSPVPPGMKDVEVPWKGVVDVVYVEVGWKVGWKGRPVACAFEEPPPLGSPVYAVYVRFWFMVHQYQVESLQHVTMS